MAALLGIAFGLGLGTVAGLSVGPYVFPRLLKPRDLSCLDETADHNDDYEVPELGTKIGADMRRLLDYTEPWTTNPDFQRVSMINRIIKIMWPTLTKAIMDTVLVQVKKQLEEKIFSNKKLGFVEDIVFGVDAMNPNGVKDFSAWVNDKQFMMGTIPPRLGGFKLYDTAEDEVILEVPVLWGSDMKMHIGAFLRFGPFRLYVPLEISNIHFKADARITLKPLVDVIPCIGGATVSLMQAPHVDLTLKAFGGVDLMALPVVKDVIRYGLKLFLESDLILPNSRCFPIMPNFGLMPAPKGAINVKLLRAERMFKSTEAFVELEIRKGRFQTSNSFKLIDGKAEIGEEFNMIVDDFEAQSLNILLHDDDAGWNDSVIGHGHLRFGEEELGDKTNPEDSDSPVEREFKLADFIRVPMQEQLVEVQLRKLKAPPKGVVVSGATAVVKAPMTGARHLGRSLSRIVGGRAHKEREESLAGGPSMMEAKDRGSIYLKVMFIPFFQPTYDDEEEEMADVALAAGVSATAQPSGDKGPVSKAKKKAAVASLVMPSVRQVTTNVPDKLKGVLTVTLIRCINLNGDDVNSYVRFLVSDDEADQVQKSQTVYSQNSPRWGQKFDFVMVTAGSSLFMTVYGKPGLAGNLLGSVKGLNVFSKKKKEGESDKVLGKLEIRVRDVVRNGTIKDVWTLQDAERGQIELVLSWQTCYISDD